MTDKPDAWLQELEDEINAEDREDRRRERERRRLGLPEPKREIKTFNGFADAGAAPRE